MHKIISSGGKILIVSTKKQASEQVSELAKDTGQFYVNYRYWGYVNKLEHNTKFNKKIKKVE